MSDGARTGSFFRTGTSARGQAVAGQAEGGHVREEEPGLGRSHRRGGRRCGHHGCLRHLWSVQPGSEVRGRPLRITENAPPSAFVAVVDGTVAGRTLSRLVRATARPGRTLTSFRQACEARAILGSRSPAPARVTVAGKPAAPGPGATAYLWAIYRKDLKTWQGKINAAKREVAMRTLAAISAWARRLPILATVTGEDPQRPGRPRQPGTRVQAGRGRPGGPRAGGR